MKKLTYYLTGLSIMLNFYYLATWIYAYNISETQGLRTEKFATFFPSTISLSTINVVAATLTILSLIALLMHKGVINKGIFAIATFAQAFFMLFYIWQYM